MVVLNEANGIDAFAYFLKKGSSPGTLFFAGGVPDFFRDKSSLLDKVLFIVQFVVSNGYKSWFRENYANKAYISY